MPQHGESLDVRVARLEERLDAHDEWKESVSGDLKSIGNWLRGVMGSLILALVLLIAQLMTGHSAPDHGGAHDEQHTEGHK